MSYGMRAFSVLGATLGATLSRPKQVKISHFEIIVNNKKSTAILEITVL